MKNHHFSQVARMLIKPMQNQPKWRSAGPKWTEMEFKWIPHGSHMGPVMWGSFQNEGPSFQNEGPPF